MTENGVIYISFPRELYDDIIRFSDGELDPAGLAEDTVRNWLFNNPDDDRWLDERQLEMAQKYSPEIAEKWEREDEAFFPKMREDRQPLVWKQVTVPVGWQVRMAYGGTYHYAEVKAGKIVDDTGSYSPAEWASKIARGTARNAWRDLWFREPKATDWVPATALREQAARRQSDIAANLTLADLGLE